MKRIAVLKIIASLLFVAAWVVIGVFTYFVATEIHTALKQDGLQGLVMQLWCGEKGCAK